MGKLTTIIFVLIAIAVLLVIIYIIIYNRLQKYLIRINEAEAEIDESIRKRYDLLLSMEKEINHATNIKENNFEDFEKEKISNFEADRKLSKVQETFRKIREDYPDDLDTELYRNLVTDLKITEEKSEAAKSYYNKYTTSLNLLIKKFPSNLIARIHNIVERLYFDNKNMNDDDILDFKF